MKTIKRIWIVALATMLVGVLIVGCAPAAQPTPTPTPSSQSPSPTPTTTAIKIGLSLATLQEERWVRDLDRITQECKDRGIELFSQVANMDAAKQQQQCESMLTQGINVLIIAPHDATAAAAIVEKAKAAGVPVISYDRLIMNADDPNMVYISFDNVKVGELQGKYITEKVPKGNYVIMSGAPTDNNAKLFKQGAMNFIQPLIDSGAIKVVLDQPVVDWKPDNAMKIMEQALTKASNDVQAVLAPNDGTAGGAIQALAAQGLAGKVPITGQDAELAAAQRIVQGSQSMTVFKDTRNLGTAAVEAALIMATKKIPTNANQVVNNDKVDVKSILLTPVAVDKTNIDKLLIDSGYLKREDVYKGASTTAIKIGLSLATLQEERWVRDLDRITQECKDRGIELFSQVANMDAAKQQQQCESMLTQGIDVLIIAPHDATAAAAIVEKANAAGVPVISYDRLIMNVDDPNMVYISFDNVKVGELQGKYITEKVPKGNYVIMSGAPTDNNAKLFKQGAMNFIQPLIDSGAIKVVLDQAVVDWKPDNAMKIMEQALTKASNDVQAVLAPNDGTAGGAIQALAAQGLAGKVPITGQDAELAAAQRIVQGSQSMTVFKDTRNLGTAAVEAALILATGKMPDNANQVVNNDKVDVKSILLTPVAVDKANIDSILIDSGYLKREEVYK